MSKWDKLYSWLNDTRLAIAPDETVTDYDERMERSAQVDIIDEVFEEMEHLEEKDDKPLINIQAIIDDLNEIHEAIWDVDIPSPTVPEYREHHEQMQGLMKLVKEKTDKWEKIRE